MTFGSALPQLMKQWRNSVASPYMLGIKVLSDRTCMTDSYWAHVHGHKDLAVSYAATPAPPPPTEPAQPIATTPAAPSTSPAAAAARPPDGHCAKCLKPETEQNNGFSHTVRFCPFKDDCVMVGTKRAPPRAWPEDARREHIRRRTARCRENKKRGRAGEGDADGQ